MPFTLKSPFRVDATPTIDEGDELEGEEEPPEHHFATTRPLSSRTTAGAALGSFDVLWRDIPCPFDSDERTACEIMIRGGCAESSTR